jgi:hypothetical protein
MLLEYLDWKDVPQIDALMEVFTKRFFPQVLVTSGRELGPEGFPMANFLGPCDGHIIWSNRH